MSLARVQPGPRATAVASVVAAMAAAALLAGVPAAAAQGPRAQDRVRLNEIQVIGTHNSYHRELAGAERDAFGEIVGDPDTYDRFLAYSHAAIPAQFADQDIRGLELDLFPDPEGGLYAEPLVRRSLDLGPLPDPAWREPGIKVFHIADLDYATTCVAFTTCLEQVRGWSEANPDHVPLLILLELKSSEDAIEAGGGVVSPPWDAGQLDALDAEIRSVFGPEDLVTPDDVRRPGRTLEESVRSRGWPTLGDSRGKVVFLIDNEGELNDVYAEGRPNLEGRVLFTNGVPGEPDAAFLKRNEPTGAARAEIQELVRAGYLVRTRSDEPLTTVLEGDTAMREAALASGAQLVSTDFPVAGMAARYDSDYVARLPEDVPARCNPVATSRLCRTARLEP